MTAPASAWRALAPLMAAPGRRQVLLVDPETKNKVGTRRISAALPTQLAAVYLYTRQGRTRLLAFDFDTKVAGRAQVDTDVATAADWLTAAGARIVADRSTSGGRHLLVPLAIGTSASFTEAAALMRAFAARLPSLDITPNLNPATGALSVPGTVCSGAGYRILDGPLADAVDAFTVGSDPALLPRLYAHFGTLPPTPGHPTVAPATTVTAGPATTGHGEHLRLATEFVWTGPVPKDVAAFAADGLLPPDGRWRSRSEARQSVIANAVLRGASYAEIRDRVATDPTWRAIGPLYTDTYKAASKRYLHRDVEHALKWATANLRPKAHQPAHRNNYTSPPEVLLWLAHALAWADRELAGRPARWKVRDVLQALAIKAAVAGEIRGGTPVVGVGGRSLSLSAGLLSPTATFEVLREIRDIPGSPILRTRRAVGLQPDYYALVMTSSEPVTPIPAERVSVVDVHPAWSVLGRHNRAVYEAITGWGLTKPADVYAAAKVGHRAGQLAIEALRIAGLITRAGHRLQPGPVTLDDLAAAHDLADALTDRIQGYRDQRHRWRAWLARADQRRTAELAHHPDCPTADHNIDEHAAYLDTLIARGPPPASNHGDDHSTAAAIELLRTEVGARVIAAR